MLEIVDVEEGQREMALRAVAVQKAVDPMLDHPPCRQAGQLVVIGGAEQLVLERLLFCDIGRGGEQQMALADLHGPVRGEKHPFGRAGGQGFLHDDGPAVA